MDKLRSTLKQFVRDWSAEGKAERDACYVPVQEALLAHFSDIPAAERYVNPIDWESQRPHRPKT